LTRSKVIVILAVEKRAAGRRPRPLAVDEGVPSMDGRCRPTGA